MLAVAAARTSGAPATDEVVLGGVACELVHLGSLYHDDVMDEADTRRTVESVNARWGNLRAILAGDFLLARASEIAASLGTEVAGLLARTIGRLCEGQIAELRHAFDTDPPASTPTSSRSAARPRRCSPRRAASGASSPSCPATQIDALTAYGHAFGMVFQIADDVLDLTATEAELGKPAGHDLVEGVYTLPVILTLAAGGTAAERAGRPARAPARRRPRSTRHSPSCGRTAGVASRRVGATARAYAGRRRRWPCAAPARRRRRRT